MYKDKEKQKEADRIRQQRRRDAKKAEGVTIAGRDEGVTVDVKNGVATTVKASFKDGVTTINSITQTETNLRDGEYTSKVLDERLVKADCPQVQAIWNRRNAQGQPALYGSWPDRSKCEAIQ